MEEGPDDYASVSDPITTGSPVAESERERAPTAVNSLDWAAHEVYDPLTYKVFASRSATVADPAPRGAYRGLAPPNDCLCPPKRKLCPAKRGLCPEEINRLGATGVQIEAQVGVCHCYFRAFCGLTPDFMTFLGWRPFFLEITCFRPEKPLEFAILVGEFLWIFDLHLVHLIQTGINFSCPRAPLELTQINFSCPPRIYFCPPPPSHAILAPGLDNSVWVKCLEIRSLTMLFVNINSELCQMLLIFLF